jgi:3-oxoacyl-[acyl-carrier protein] reductase
MSTQNLSSGIWTVGHLGSFTPQSDLSLFGNHNDSPMISGQWGGQAYGIDLSFVAHPHVEADHPSGLAKVEINFSSSPTTTETAHAGETMGPHSNSTDTCHVIEVLTRPEARQRKTILVTGASGGMGTAICDHLAQKGYNLILAARNLEKLSEQARELKSKFGGYYVPVAIDFNDAKSMQDLAHKLSVELDGLVLMPPRIPPSSEVLPENNVWMSVFEQTFVNPLSLIREIVPNMRKEGRSKVVIISGISSVQVISNYALNNSIRAAWLAQAKTLAFAYGERNIHFNTLSIGGAMTPKYVERMKKKAESNGVSFEDQMKEEVSNVPLGKYASLEDISNAVEGLLGSMTDHMTGANFLLDGGFIKTY